MTLIGKLKLGFRAIVMAVAVLMALNFGELLWVTAWQVDTDQAVENSQAAAQLALSLERMTSIVEDLGDTVFEGGSVSALETPFDANGEAAKASLDSILASDILGQEDRATVEGLQTEVEGFVQEGDELLSSEVDETNVMSQGSPVRILGTRLQGSAREFQESTQDDIAARLDLLGKVSLVCLIVTAVLGIVAVIAGVLVSILIPRRIGHELNGAATGISSSAAELMAIASQVAAGTAQTAASTNETTVTVEEVKQTAILASEKASQVVESVEGAVKVTEAGITQVEGTIAGIERMHESMDVVFETITRLSERAEAAGDVIAAVNDLAERSNLLSVNASIEAAKAGEYGRGFTVVAQEVKSLAEQSKQAVGQVRTILSEIQKASETAVRAAVNGRDSIEAGRRQSIEAGEVIQNLAEGASGVAESAVQISASSRQQLAGMEQISQAIVSINQAGNQSVTGTRQVEQEVKHLQELALQLKQLVQIDTDQAAQ